jgi:hypothetical protein
VILRFVGVSLQLIAAARLPGRVLSEVGVKPSLAFSEGAKPEGEIECALSSCKMACTHGAAMAVLSMAEHFNHG